MNAKIYLDQIIPEYKSYVGMDKTLEADSKKIRIRTADEFMRNAENTEAELQSEVQAKELAIEKLNEMKEKAERILVKALEEIRTKNGLQYSDFFRIADEAIAEWTRQK